MHIFPDPTIIAFQLIPFVVLLIAMNALVFQPMLNYLEERKKRIEGASSVAKNLGGDSSHKAKEIEQQLSKARNDVAEIRNRILRDAQAREKQILEAARLEMETSATEFRKQLESTRVEESSRLRSEVDTLGTNIAGRVLGRSV